SSRRCGGRVSPPPFTPPTRGAGPQRGPARPTRPTLCSACPRAGRGPPPPRAPRAPPARGGDATPPPPPAPARPAPPALRAAPGGPCTLCGSRRPGAPSRRAAPLLRTAAAGACGTERPNRRPAFPDPGAVRRGAARCLDRGVVARRGRAAALAERLLLHRLPA